MDDHNIIQFNLHLGLSYRVIRKEFRNNLSLINTIFGLIYIEVYHSVLRDSI